MPFVPDGSGVTKAPQNGFVPDSVDTPESGFIKSVGKTLSQAVGSVAETVTPGVEKVKQAKSVVDTLKATAGLAADTLTAPAKVGAGAVEAFASGAAGLATSAISGLTLIGEKLTGQTGGVEAIHKAVSSLPISAETKIGKNFENVLGLLPEGIHALGEAVYEGYGPEKFGAAALGAGVEGLATLLTLKPGIAGKTVKAVMGKKADSTMKAAAEDAFDNLAKENPESVEKLVNHIEKADPKLAKELAARIKSITPDAKDVKAIFNNAMQEGLARTKGEVTETQLKQIFDDAKKIAAKGKEDNGPPANDAAKLAQERAENQARQEADQIKQKQIDAAWEKKKDFNPLVNTPIQAAANLRDTIRQSLENAEEVYTDLSTGLETAPTPTTPMGQAMRRAAGPGGRQGGAVDPKVFAEGIGKAFDALGSGIKKLPLVIETQNALARSTEQLIRSLNPESLGPIAKDAAATIGSVVARKVHETTKDTMIGKARTEFFDKLGEEKSFQFILDAEKGKVSGNAALEKARQAYERGYRAIYEADKAHGIDYESVDHYFKHAFEDDPRLNDFLTTERAKWGDPSFTKARDAALYEAALKNGFKPKFKNPEDLYQSRLLASREAHAKIDMLRDMADYGMARKLGKGETVNIGEARRRAPNGDIYAVHDHAEAILKNAFESQSLYNLEGMAGLAVSLPARGLLSLKNKLVPAMLTLSGFHPLHVLFIDAAAEMSRVSSEMLNKNASFPEWVGRMAKAGVLAGTYSNPKAGGRLNRVWRGDLAEKDMTVADKAHLELMIEGGFIPELSSQFRSDSMGKFKRALDQKKISAAYHAPWALLDALQKPMFEVWIPNMKAASYIRDAQAVLKAKPELLSDRLQRQVALRQVAKSVDNRYGEMNYDTLFAEKWVKDIGVMSMLSMGWELGFIREYGGAALETAKSGADAAKKLVGIDTGMQGRIPPDRMNKALFVGAYTAQAMLVGGLMTTFMGGASPQNLDDLINPRTGGDGPDGKPKRVSTMFLTREFSALGHETASQGFGKALGTYALNKIGPGPKLVENIYTNLDHFNHEISNPDAQWLTQQGQRLDYILGKGKPISTQDWDSSSPKERAMRIAGFAPAPKYVNETHTEALIKATFGKYHGVITPFEKGDKGKDMGVLRKARSEGDSEKYSEQLSLMQEKYKLNSKEMDQLKKSSRTDPLSHMFQALTSEQQLTILKKATPEERPKLIHLAHEKTKKEFRQLEVE